MSKVFFDRLKKLGYNSYNEYLKSNHWNNTKQKYKQSNLPQKCIGCNNNNYELHHTSYARLGNELLTDFVPLCHKCHIKVHNYHVDNNIPLHHIHVSLAKLFKWKSKEFVKKKLSPFNKNRKCKKPKHPKWHNI